MKEKNENVIELTNTEKNNGESNTTSEVKEEITLRKRIRRIVSSITVELSLVCYLVPYALGSLAVYQLNMEKACRTELKYNKTLCLDVVHVTNNDNITTETRIEVSTIVADMTAWQEPLQSAIPGILILFVGAWSDRTGNRKALMLMPILGEIVSVCGLFLANYNFLEWPLWTTALIEAIPSALSGGPSIIILGTFSYIADVTTVESRTFRIGIVTVIATLAIPFGVALSGILTQEVGYYGIFGIQLILYILAFIYTYFRIQNVNKNEAIEGTFMTKLTSFFNPHNLWDTISLLIVTPRKQRIRIILVLCAFVLIFGPTRGESSITYLYVTNRYSMTPVDISFFNTYHILIGTAGTTVAVALFSKYFKMHDSMIGVIATASKTVSSIVYGLAPNKQWYFAGPVFDFFGNSGITAARSIGTKVVDPDKVGKISSLMGLVESLVPVIYAPLFTKMYNKTLSTWPGAVYFLGSIMVIPAFFVFMAIYFMHRKEDRDVVKDPTAKETHAHDNDVTPL